MKGRRQDVHSPWLCARSELVQAMPEVEPLSLRNEAPSTPSTKPSLHLGSPQTTLISQEGSHRDLTSRGVGDSGSNDGGDGDQISQAYTSLENIQVMGGKKRFLNTWERKPSQSLWFFVLFFVLSFFFP